MEASICKICKDPIWSFICIDCLEKDIIRWLPTNFVSEFKKFHKDIIKFFYFNASGFERCLKCKSFHEASVCPYCYINEVYLWLENKNQKLAKEVAKMIPRDFVITEKDGCNWRDGIKPIIETEIKKTNSGICEICGEYSENLKEINGKWICEECEDQL